MSREVKHLRSTICRDLSDTSPVVTNFDQSWDRLPLELAIYIYRFLPMTDKRNMSLTCKFWLAAFKHPGTWRYFLFTGVSSKRKRIRDEVLSSIQYVTIQCSVPRYDVHQSYIEKKMRNLASCIIALKRSENTTLQQLNILDMKDVRDYVTKNLHYNLYKLLANQTKLCRLSLFNGGFETAQGLKLLTAAGENNAHCLKYLNVCNFLRQRSPPASELTFAEICGTFTNLVELRLNCGFMSDDLFNHLSGTLKLIIVWVHSFDFDCPGFNHNYSDNGWSVLVSKCTGLKAEYHVEIQYLARDISLWWILLPAVPLATLHWCTRGGDLNIIRTYFDEIINFFKNGLEHLQVDGACNILRETDAVAIVERCPLLQTFSISPKSAPQKLISEVDNILAQRRQNKRLQTGTFTAT